MKKVTKLVLMLSLVLLGAFYNAYCATETENGIEKNKPKIAIIKSQHGGTDKSGSIIPSIYDNVLSVMFTENLGQNGNVGQKVLDLRELTNGVYTITILCGEYYQTEKLVVTK